MKRKLITVTYFDEKGSKITQVQRPNYREQMKEKQQQIKVFKFIYLDRQGNVLEEFERPCKSKRHSLELADFILKTSLMRDLHKIKTRKIKELVFSLIEMA